MGAQAGQSGTTQQGGQMQSGQAQGGQMRGGQMQQYRQRAQSIPVEPVGMDRLARDEVVTADRDTPIATIVAMMSEQDVGTVVITEDDRPVGIITDRKITLAMEETPDLTDSAVEDLMTEDPVTVDEDEEMFDVLQTLAENDIRRVPVVDDEGELTGILSIDDVLVILAGELSAVSDVVQAQSPRF